MMGPPEVMIALTVIGLPILAVMLIANRWFRLREKKIDAEVRLATEKAAQYASGTKDIEQRLRVLEQIVTDGGAQTAAQIEALRKPRISSPDEAQG